jgi:hypothetical protein
VCIVFSLITSLTYVKKIREAQELECKDLKIGNGNVISKNQYDRALLKKMKMRELFIEKKITSGIQSLSSYLCSAEDLAAGKL